jgi:excisionase family DNA binding protein
VSTFTIRRVKVTTGQRQLFDKRGDEPSRASGRPTRIGDLPELLTVEEAARYLRIGRGSAYELARRFRLTDGREGLPVLVLGRTLRVPRHALERLLAIDTSNSAARHVD